MNLSGTGVVLNKWITLENAFERVSFQANNNLKIIPQATQFYFDETNELVFVRHTSGIAYIMEDKEEVKNGFVEIEHDGKRYQSELRRGGVNDSKIGVYHDVYALHHLIGLVTNKD